MRRKPDRPAIQRRGRLVVVAAAALAAWHCGSSAITAPRVEQAMEQTFANLVEVQASWLHLQPMRPSEFDVTASCRRFAAETEHGAGEWVCRLRWLGPDRQPLLDTFDLSVTSDGCYTASAEGEHLGGLTLTANDGHEVRNVLHVFEGCFDTM